MAKVIMKYQEQFVNFPGKQGLAIKTKQRFELFDIISCQLPTIKLYIFFFFKNRAKIYVKKNKNKQRFELFEVFLTSSADPCFFFFKISDQIGRGNEQNYTANMIMNVSGTVFQLIHYFHGKQRLAIDLLWPALKSKQHTYIEFVDIISWSM